jgi:hypothetical protein
VVVPIIKRQNEMTDRDFKLRIRLEAVKDWAKCGIHHNHAHNEQKLEYNLQVLNAVIKAVEELDQKAVELDRLKTEIRDFKLLTRTYFQQHSIVENKRTDYETHSAAWDKREECMKKILTELEAFTQQEQQELPFN